MRNLVIGISVLLLGACNISTNTPSPSDPGPKEPIESNTGTIVGDALADDIAEGRKNAGLTTALGAFIRDVIGQSIGSQLDELDRQMAQSAYKEALEYNRSDVSADWVNPDSGNSGSFTPTRTHTMSGRYCREYTQEIIIGGQKQTSYGTACRQPDGNWEIVS